MMSDEIAGLAPKWLHPHDLVSVYSLDCVLTGTAHDLPADTTSLKQAVDNALAQGLSRTPVESADRCPQPYSLRDAVAYAAMQLRNSPGRRVLLVVVMVTTSRTDTRRMRSRSLQRRMLRSSR
jgi:hypothetical protein